MFALTARRRAIRSPISATDYGVRSGRQIVAAFSALVFLGSRLWWAASSTLDPDEAFSLRIVRHSWNHLVSATVSDIVHPPLFYLLLKAWLASVGEHIVVLRLLPVFFAVLSIVPYYLLCRELRLSAPVANLGFFLWAVNPFLIRYSQELRMYSLFLLLGLTSMWLLVRYARTSDGSRRSLIALTIVNFLMVYAHYHAWVLIALEALFLLWHERPTFWPFLWSTVCVALAFLPWAIIVAEHAKASGGIASGLNRHLRWLTRPGWADVATYFARLNGPFRRGLGFSKLKVAIGIVLFGLPITWVLARRSKLMGRSRPEPGGVQTEASAEWLAFFALAPIVVVYAVSQALPNPVFEPRYLITASVPYLLLGAFSIREIVPGLLRTGVTALAIAWATAGLGEGARLEDHVDWIALVSEMRKIETAAPPGVSPVPVFSLAHAEPIRYALEVANDQRFVVRSIRAPEQVTGSRVWLAYQESYWDPGATTAFLRGLAEAGYVIVKDLESGLSGHSGHLGLWRRPDGSSAGPRATNSEAGQQDFSGR